MKTRSKVSDTAKAARNAYMRAYRAANRARLLAQRREWLKNNRKRHNLESLLWKKRNPVKVRAYAKKWRSEVNPEAYKRGKRKHYMKNRRHYIDEAFDRRRFIVNYFGRKKK